MSKEETVVIYMERLNLISCLSSKEGSFVRTRMIVKKTPPLGTAQIMRDAVSKVSDAGSLSTGSVPE